jgi:hypothetical protein
MSRPPLPRLTRLQSTGLLGGAGVGLALGKALSAAWPGSMAASLGGWPGLAQGLLLGGAAWLWWRRGRQPASLRPQLQVLPKGISGGGLHFAPAGPCAWQARRGGWRLELRRDGPEGLPWRLQLRRGDRLQGTPPLTQGASLAALLALTRRLTTQAGLLGRRGAPSPQSMSVLLDCDLEFPLPHGNWLTALAEGGFALRDGLGLHGISAETAEALLAEATIGAGRA